MAVAFLAVGLSWGDDKKDPKGTLPPRYKELGLSDDQSNKIKKIHGEYKEKIDDLKAQLKKLEAEEKTEYLKVLTDEQKKKLAQLTIGDKPEDKKEDKKPEK
jgi:Spy/CpxP family protein refolding chaperone